MNTFVLNTKISDKPWILKHQPTSKNICGNQNVIQVLHKSLSNNSFPHLLYGPSGTGKPRQFMQL